MEWNVKVEKSTFASAHAFGALHPQLENKVKQTAIIEKECVSMCAPNGKNGALLFASVCI